MRDSLGSYTTLTFIMFAIVLITGFLAFSVNYNKAFKMKNKAIYIIEKHNNDVNAARNEIKEYADLIGYSGSSYYTGTCAGDGYTVDSDNVGWCFKVVPINGTTTGGSVSYDKTNGSVQEYQANYVDVITFASIDIPFFGPYFFSKLPVFRVKGSTKRVTSLK